MTRLRDTLAAHGRYLVRESILILLFSYVILVGGGAGGLIVTPLRLVNTALLAIIGVLWLVTRLLRRRSFPATPLDAPLLTYLGVHAVTVITSMDPRRSAMQLWLLGLYVLVFYLFVDLLRHGWPEELLVKTLLVAGAVVLVLGTLEIAAWYRSWHAIWGWERPLPATTTRVGASVGDPNWMAALLNLLWPLALTRLWAERQRVPRLLLVLWLAVAAVLLYFTSSRGGWLGTIGALATLLLLSRALRRALGRALDWLTARCWRLLFGGLVALGAGAAFIFLLLQQLRHPSHGGVLASRAHFWRTAWVAFRSSPLWGTGPLTYGETYLLTHSVPPERLYGVAHSYPINLAAESGLLGLAALAWLAVALVRTLWMSWGRLPPQGRAIRVGALAALVSCAVHSQFDSVAGVPYVSIILAFLLALLLKDREPAAIPPWLAALAPEGVISKDQEPGAIASRLTAPVIGGGNPERAQSPCPWGRSHLGSKPPSSGASRPGKAMVGEGDTSQHHAPQDGSEFPRQGSSIRLGTNSGQAEITGASKATWDTSLEPLSSGSRLDQERDRHRPRRWQLAAWLLPIGWALLLSTAVWSLRATLPFSRGLSAADAGRWQEAASLLDSAAQRDPRLAAYALQAGYAHARLAAAANPDAAHLDAAITHYRAGIERSPNYALNAAHLGALCRQAGDSDQALAWTRRAVDLAPRSALFALNLGRLHEGLDQHESAIRHYQKALNRAPEWARAPYWRATPLRQTVSDDWLAAHPRSEPPENPGSARQWSIVGRHALEEDRPTEALSAFDRAVARDPHDVAAHVGQARAYLALGRTAEAERALQTALLGGVTLELSHARALATLADVYHQQGESEKAIQALQAAIDNGRRALTQQPYMLGWRSYPQFLFYRESPAEYLLPQLAVITITDDVADWMLQLGAWHEQAGDPAAAAAVYRQLLQEAPNFEPARRRLTALEP